MPIAALVITMTYAKASITSSSPLKFGWPFAQPIGLRRKESNRPSLFPGGGFMIQLKTRDDHDDETMNERNKHQSKIRVRVARFYGARFSCQELLLRLQIDISEMSTRGF